MVLAGIAPAIYNLNGVKQEFGTQILVIHKIHETSLVVVQDELLRAYNKESEIQVDALKLTYFGIQRKIC